MRTTYTAAKAPGPLPVLGHALPLLRNPWQFLSSLPAYGDLVQIRVGPVMAIVVCDPELTHQVLLDDRTFDKGGFFLDRLREIGGNGLITCRHSDHRWQRRLIQPSFHRTRMPSYARTMTGQITKVTGAWRDGQIIDVCAEMLTTAGRVALATMFTTVPPQLSETLLAHVVVIQEGIYQRMLMPPLLDKFPTPGKRRYDQAHARLRQAVDGIIADYLSSGADHGDLMSMLLAVRGNPAGAEGDRQALSDAEINDQVVTFFGAGVETTANALAWALHLLGRHPDIEKRLHTEVDTVLAGGAATVEHLPELELTAKFVMESLRLYPPGWLLTRTTTTDAELGGLPIPAGTTVVYSPYLVHRRPDLYPDPEVFDPDRWSAERAKAIPRGGYIPFAAGARKCIGDTFAMTEATLMLATIAARWHLEPIPGQQVRPALGPVMSPRGLRMRVTSRQGLGRRTRPARGSCS